MRSWIEVSTALLLAAVAFLPAAARPAHAEASGKHVFKAANCVGCHQWFGTGGGGYGGAAANLRTTSLDRQQIIETIRCGRPGAGMPYFEQGAYSDGRCYGMKKGEMEKGQMPPAPDHFLQPAEIAAVADYVIATFKDKGPPTFAECSAFFGHDTRACDNYPKTGAKPASAASTPPAHEHTKVERAPDNNAVKAPQ